MAEKMWRPPNWDILKPIPYNPKDGESTWDFYEHGVEAGADELLRYFLDCGIISISQLEALKKSGNKYNKERTE